MDEAGDALPVLNAEQGGRRWLIGIPVGDPVGAEAEGVSGQSNFSRPSVSASLRAAPASTRMSCQVACDSES